MNATKSDSNGDTASDQVQILTASAIFPYASNFYLFTVF